MSKRILVCALLAGSVASASADDITFYFGRPEYYTGTATTAFVADSYAPLAVTLGTYTLGIWANVGYDSNAGCMDVWNGISMSIVARTPGGVADPSVAFSGVAIDNFDHRIGPGTAYRWEYDIDPEPLPGEFFVYSVAQHGLGGLWTREWDLGNGYTDWWSYADGSIGAPGAKYRYWLGNVTLSCADTSSVHEVYFQVGMGGIARQGGSVTDDRIYFGEDEPIGLRGDAFLQISSLPDFVFTPEPAGCVLIGLGVLALRRRSGLSTN